jgi:NAD(P)-dependent dehydrogenase (short-subunit alcohol dehydrogenase family)
MWAPLARDARGNESHFSTNHLGHFQLTGRLRPALQKANGARVVNVSSRGHHFSAVDFEDPNFERREYDHLKAYGQSKTANILFTVALDENGRNEGIRAFAVHPGGILDTELGRNISMDEPLIQGYLDADGKPILDPINGLKTVEQGAATQIWCATNPKLNGRGGVYAEDCEIADITPEKSDVSSELDEVVRTKGVMSYAIDRESAARLWTLSERLISA